MTVKLTFNCPGPEGGNGCPEGHQDIIAWGSGSHDGVKSAWESVISQALAKGWKKRPKDQRLHCPQCSERFIYPSEIAGIPLERWLEAARLVESGRPPSSWAGRDGLPTARQWNNTINRLPWVRDAHHSLPDYKPRGDVAEPLPEAMWERVIERFRAGESKKDICTGEDGWPTPKQWSGRLERNENFRSAIVAHREWRKRAVEAQVDRALETYEIHADRPLYELLDVSGKNAWFHRLQKDGDFRRRVRAAHEQRLQVIRQEMEPLYEAALLLIEEGCDVTRLPGQPQTVTSAAIHKRIGRDPEFAARYYSSVKMGFLRKSANQKIRSAERFDQIFDQVVGTLDWDGVIEDIQKGVSAYEALEKPNRPNRGQWVYRRRMDKNFSDAVDIAFNSQKRIKELEHKRAMRDRKLRGPEEAIGTEFNRQLRQNDLYSAVNSAISLSIPSHIRDDIISSMVLAVLEGEFGIEEVGRRAKEFKSQYHKSMETYKMVSYDQTVAGTDDLKMIDKFSNEDALFHDWDDEGDEDDNF